MVKVIYLSVTFPTWYTNVSYFKEWIDSYIASEQPPEVVITKPDFLVITEETEEGEDTVTEGEEGDSVTEEEEVTDTEECNAYIDGQYVVFGCEDDEDDSSGGSLGYMYLMLMLLLAAGRRKVIYR